MVETRRKWTRDTPDITDLKDARKRVGKNFPVLVDSGATKDNIDTLLRYDNGIIVGTSLKTGKIFSKEK